MIGASTPDPEFVAARRVLLDALEALGAHRKAVVLVGAQAIYLHVGEARGLGLTERRSHARPRDWRPPSSIRV